MKSKNRFYVYALYRDETLQNPFYIGKGEGKRFSASQKIAKGSVLKNQAIKKRLEMFGYVPAKKLANNLTEKQAFELEIFWIAFYGRIDKRSGILTNVTDGGEGSAGRIVSEAERKKKSIMFTGRKMAGDTLKNLVIRNKNRIYNSEDMAQKARMLVITDEVRAAMSRGQKGRIHSQESCEKRAASMRKITATTAWQERHKAIHTGRKRSAATCAKISEKAKMRCQTDEGKENLKRARALRTWDKK